MTYAPPSFSFILCLFSSPLPLSVITKGIHQWSSWGCPWIGRRLCSHIIVCTYRICRVTSRSTPSKRSSIERVRCSIVGSRGSFVHTSVPPIGRVLVYFRMKHVWFHLRYPPSIHFMFAWGRENKWKVWRRWAMRWKGWRRGSLDNKGKKECASIYFPSIIYINKFYRHHPSLILLERGQIQLRKLHRWLDNFPTGYLHDNPLRLVLRIRRRQLLAKVVPGKKPRGLVGV